MKVISKIFNILLVSVVLTSLIAAVGSAITKKPVLLTVIRSNSMYPVWERGDMVVIDNLNLDENISKGDIVFFKAKKGSLATKGWIAHRIIGGNAEEGFITKGDANKYSDQESDDTGPIERKWIGGRAMVVGKSPMVLDKIGYLSLWMEEYQSNPLLLPGFALILGIIIAIGELKTGKKRRKKSKSKGMEQSLIYFIGGLSISIIVGGTMISSGHTLNQSYEVSEQSQGVIMGSDVGILKVGDTVSRPLSEIKNEGVFPLIAAITTNDKQVKLSHNKLTLSKGQQINAIYTVNAEHPGKYKATIKVGLFYPLLPSSLVYFFAKKSYWLALISVSIVPGLPLIIYPFIDGKMRRKTFNVIRKKRRKFQRDFQI
ncbi:signal peptidase I [Neobacillus drentensis]|uniref:signal peptidase I n=1 Tax=Neobacillus drentensis TaxID=220684 RepID=UPI002862C24A|nr:signal peptidase I [Neobacillus drentensis]MDR7239079.1 signal peptidase [Neobacillus drentensis]